METAIKVKFAMLEPHISRPEEYGYNSFTTQYFETQSDFFEAWGESMPSGRPNEADENSSFMIHKRFGTVYVDDSNIPVALVQIEECPVEEAMKAAQRR